MTVARSPRPRGIIPKDCSRGAAAWEFQAPAPRTPAPRRHEEEAPTRMCRNIRTLFNFDPPATDEEIRAASLQFVRKLSGFNTPSKANEAIFHKSIDEVAAVARRLIDSLTTTAPTRDRDVEAAKAKERSAQRFGRARA